MPLGDEHVDQLLAPGHDRQQVRVRVIGQGPRRRPKALREQRQHAGVDRVRLGELAESFGEVAHLAGIDDRHGQAGQGQRRGDQRFVAAGRFEHYQRGRGRRDGGDQRSNARRVVRIGVAGASADTTRTSRCAFATSMPR